ncbi:zinc transporter ZntB [Neptuniibacter sp. CAU 1671]|uniref:zinc transporter ZntB n=1 Tax=Neptuniibacter sp. CAU 1671 TaxID=3032593 RepID=UPI0023DB642A|nr:zinc transporter ZntB [Neptuniibacter sp. CAU 1671]MDF2181697.1 zinc transporter ZntB [Neptuniibacter sp. CAU 1671]
MSDQGLVYGYRLDGQGGGTALTWDDIHNWREDQGPIWLHFDYTDSHTQQWIRQESGLDPLVADALLKEESRPRASQLDNNALLLALRGVNLSPGSNPEDMVGIRIWSDGKRIISTRKRRMLSAQDLVKALEEGTGPCSIGDFITQLTYRLIGRMQNTIQDTEDHVDEIEDQVLVNSGEALRSQIANLRRQVIGLRRYLAPQRDAMLQLQTLRITWLSDLHRQSLREVTDHLIRYLEDLDSVRDRASVAQEELSNQLSEQMNSRMYVLSLVAAVFLPLGFLTGMLGVNVAGIPGTENPAAFWWFSGILVVLVVLQLWYFKRKGWL